MNREKQKCNKSLLKLQKAFPSASHETWVEKYRCALRKAKLPVCGKIYITSNWLFFKSSFVKKSIRLKDIQFIQKTSITFLLPSGLDIVTVDGKKFTFVGFKTHKICFSIEEQIEALARKFSPQECPSPLKREPPAPPANGTSQPVRPHPQETESVSSSSSGSTDLSEISCTESQTSEVEDVQAQIETCLQNFERRMQTMESISHNIIVNESCIEEEVSIVTAPEPQDQALNPVSISELEEISNPQQDLQQLQPQQTPNLQRREAAGEVARKGSFLFLEKCRGLVLIASVLGFLVIFPELEKKPLAALLFSGICAILVDMVEPSQTLKDFMDLLATQIPNFGAKMNIEVTPASRGASIVMTSFLLFFLLELLPRLKFSFLSGFVAAILLTTGFRGR